MLSRRSLLIPLALALVFGSIPGSAPPAMATSGPLVLEDGQELAASIEAQTITIPAGATVYYSESITLKATEWIRIDGQLRNHGDAGARDIVVEAGSWISVAGNIVAGDGADGDGAADASSAQGGAGGAGGSITLRWSLVETLVVEAGALVRSGDGGDGGAANATTSATSPRAIEAQGGAGGKGGDLHLVGGSAFVYGLLDVGNGGRGGNASTWSTSDRPTDGSVTFANATGGAGGDSGDLTLPAGQSVLTLVNSGQLVGGAGGTGGNATGGGNEIASSSCGGDGYHSPDDRQTRNGGDGCDGTTDSKTGGNGGSGSIIGGDGGSATAVGLYGTTGGNGAHGQASTTWACWEYVVGGWGGAGGDGGSAFARGGDGGWGFVRGGNGGVAYAEGANGAPGGAGGNGGRSPDRCSANLDMCAYQGAGHCFIEPATGAGCGHAGSGGDGGTGGYGSATGGYGGGATTGLSGLNGAGNAHSGGTGTRGTNGALNCNHAAGHTHY